MPSEDFYRGYQAGILDDELQHCLMWFAIYEIYIETRQLLENALAQASIHSEPEKVAA